MNKFILAGMMLSTSLALFSFSQLYTVPVCADEAGVPFDEEHFPDKNFRKQLKSFDTNNDGFFSDSELADVSILKLSECGILNMDGVEYFTSLKELYLNENFFIEKLDLSNNAELEILSARVNKIKTIRFAPESKLKKIDLSYNFYLQELDCSSCHELKELLCERNELTTLDVSKAKDLITLECGGNKLTKLDLSNNSALEVLKCQGNYIQKLDLTANSELKELNCAGNKNKNLLLSENNNLTILDYSDNDLRLFDTSIIPNISELTLDGNELISINLSNMPHLEMLSISANKFTSIDLSKAPNLKIFVGSYNQFSSIDFSKNTPLELVDVCHNNFASIDVSMLKKLECLYCADNKLTNVDVSMLSELEGLEVSGNELTSLDLRSNRKLEQLMATQNNLKKLYLDNHPKLDTLLIYMNQIDVVDVSKCPALLSRLERFGVEDCVTYYEGRYDDGGSIPPIYIEIDTPCLLKGFRLPNANPIEGTVGDFIDRLYTVAMNRKPDSEGKKYWVDAVTSGQKTGADCAQFFLIDAPEFLNRNLNNKDFLQTLYKTFFDREGDADGMAFYLKKLEEGTSRQDIIHFFIDSKEWCDICASYGVKSGAVTAKATIATRNSMYFTIRLFDCAFGRFPDKQGFEYWSLALTNHEQTGASAATFFFESEEFLSFEVIDDEYIYLLYNAFMAREPEDGAIDYWKEKLHAGMTRHDVLVFFIQCQEFDEICRSYAIEKGSF